MFFGLGLAKVFVAIVTPIMVGLVLLPARVLLPLVGWLLGVGGAIFLFSGYLREGLISLGIGAVLVLLGLWIGRREAREQARQAEETAGRIQRMMSFHIPKDK